MHRSWPGVRFGAGAYDAAAPPIAGYCKRLSSAFLSSLVAADIRLFIFPEIAFVVSFIELMSSAAFVFSFIELMLRPLENLPRNEFPLSPTASDGSTCLGPELSCSAETVTNSHVRSNTAPSSVQHKVAGPIFQDGLQCEWVATNLWDLLRSRAAGSEFHCTTLWKQIAQNRFEIVRTFPAIRAI